MVDDKPIKEGFSGSKEPSWTFAEVDTHRRTHGNVGVAVRDAASPGTAGIITDLKITGDMSLARGDHYKRIGTATGETIARDRTAYDNTNHRGSGNDVDDAFERIRDLAANMPYDVRNDFLRDVRVYGTRKDVGGTQKLRDLNGVIDKLNSGNFDEAGSKMKDLVNRPAGNLAEVDRQLKELTADLPEDQRKSFLDYAKDYENRKDVDGTQKLSELNTVIKMLDEHNYGLAGSKLKDLARPFGDSTEAYGRLKRLIDDMPADMRKSFIDDAKAYEHRTDIDNTRELSDLNSVIKLMDEQNYGLAARKMKVLAYENK